MNLPEKNLHHSANNQDLFTDYQELLFHCAPFYQHKDLEAMIRQQLKDKQNDHSLVLRLKMKIKNLTMPCQQAIDVRPWIKNQVVAYCDQELTHYLDTATLVLFESLLDKFDGHYNKAIYSQCLAEAQKRYQKLTQANCQSINVLPQAKSPTARQLTTGGNQVAIVNISRSAFRASERWHYRCPLKIIEAGKQTPATSINISRTGMEISLLEQHLNPLWLRQLGTVLIQFSMSGTCQPLAQPFSMIYTIRRVEKFGKQIRLGLQLSDTIDYPGKEEFFVQVSASKNLCTENTELALTGKGFEQLTMSGLSSLPILLKANQVTWDPVAQLNTEENQALASYWKNDQDLCQWPILLKRKEIQEQLASNKIFSYYYAILRHQGKNGIHFYAARLDQQLSLPQQALFILGKKLNNLKIVKVSCHPIHEQDAVINQAIPVECRSRIKDFNSIKLQRLLKNANYLATITDVSATFSLWQKVAWSGENNIKHLLAKMKLPATSYADIEHCTMEKHNFRAEDRYSFVMPVIVRVNNKQVNATTVNVSCHGMMIKLDEPVEGLSRDDQVQLTLPQYKLNDVSYHIVAARTHRHLQLVLSSPAEQQKTVSFFKQLLFRHLDKLELVAVDGEIPGLSRAMRNIYSTHFGTAQLYLNCQTDTCQVSAVAFSPEQLLCRQDDSQQHQLRDTLGQLASPQQLTQLWPQIVARQQCLLFILLDTDNQYQFHLAENFSNKAELRRFLAKNQLNCKLYCWQLTVKAAQPMFNKYFDDEYLYLESISQGRGEAQLKEVKETTHIVSAIDVTQLSKLFVPTSTAQLTAI
jgi:hypothetical protein